MMWRNGGARNNTTYGSGHPLVLAFDDGRVVVVALAGEFDIAVAASVRAALTCAINEAPSRLIVDLSKVTFIDSSGLHILLRTHRLCHEAESRLTIRPGPPNVQRVFELTNLVDRLPFEIAAEPS